MTAIALSAIILPASALAATLTRPLSVGMSGADVSSLQTFLSQDPIIYPQGLVTGYFGPLTKAAVVNFQTRNEIDPVGRVGPVTLPVINTQIVNGMYGLSNVSVVGNAPIVAGVSVNASRNSSAVSWNTNNATKGIVYYNTSPLNLSETMTNVIVNGGSSVMTDSMLRNYESIALTNLAANTTYYYMVYVTDQAGNVSVSWPSTFQTTN